MFERVLVSLLGFFGLVSCRCEPAQPDVQPVAVTQQKEERRCAGAPGGFHFTIDAMVKQGSAQDFSGAALPFAVELGRVIVASNGAIIVPFLRGDGLNYRAGLSYSTADMQTWQTVDLGRVHGETSPPKLAASGAAIFVSLEEGDAVGGAYRIGRLMKANARVEWLGSVDADNDAARGFDLAASDSPPRAFLVHDEWNKSENRSQIRFTAVGENREPVSRRVTDETVDAIRPVLVPRVGGFWLAWVLVSNATPTAAVGKAHTLAPMMRKLMLTKLDMKGNAEGEPLWVQTGGEPAQAFDVAAGHDDSVLFAWRAYSGPPGTSGGKIGLTRVGSGGSMVDLPIEMKGASSGAPVLLFDHDPKGGAPHGWVVVGNAAGETEFAALSPLGDLLEPLMTDSLVGPSAILAAKNGRLLISSFDGRALALAEVTCLDTLIPTSNQMQGDSGSRR